MSRAVYETDYTIEKSPDTDWVRICKGGKTEAFSPCSDEALRTIHKFEGKKHDDFFVVHKGIVSRVDKGEL